MMKSEILIDNLKYLNNASSADRIIALVRISDTLIGMQVDHNLSLIEFESVLLPTQNGPAS